MPTPPPCPPSTISTNPHFAKLERHLTHNVFSPFDTSTQRTSLAPRLKAVKDELRRFHETAAREAILLELVRDVSLRPDHTINEQNDLGELCHIVSSYVRSGLNDSVMDSQIQKFHNSMPETTKILEGRIESIYDDMSEMTSCSPSTSDELASTRKLDENVECLVTRLRTLQFQTLPENMKTTTNTLTQLLSLYTRRLELQIQWLEQYRHGKVARHEIARAGFLSSVAKGIEEKSRLGYLSRVLDGEVQEELRSRMEMMIGEEGRVRERKEALEAVVGEYEDLGVREVEIMKKLGKRYRDIEEEMEQIKRDVERVEAEKQKKVMK